MSLDRNISGAGGGGKSGGGDSRSPVESPNSLRSVQYAKIQDLTSEGEIGGLHDGLKSVFLNDTPIQNPDGTFNFKNVVMDERVGTQTQASMPGFSGAEAETAVSTEVTNASPVIRTITNTNDTDVRVTLGFPQMTLQDTETGDLGGTSVRVAIDIQNNGGGYIAQVLRNIYSASYFSVTGSGAVTTQDSTSIKVTVDWTGQALATPQTCTFQLQYRAVGDVTWLVSQTFTFTGGATISTTGGSLSGITTQFPQDSKTFTLTLASDTYELRVVKTTGSKQNPPFLGSPVAPSVGAAFGGSVAITAGQIFVPDYTDVITGKTTSRYQRAYRLSLPTGGPWDIRVRRITADNGSAILQNKTFWDSLTEIVDVRLAYPNRAYIGLRIDSKQFNSIPTRGYEIKGMLIQVPSNYDPETREYDGAWDGTFQVLNTDNPAWIFYDIIVNERYGIGEFIDADQVEKWALYSIAQYCDEMVDDGFGGIEPRFTCNLYLQAREDAFKVIANIASIFRGIAWWSAGAITASQDAPVASVSQIFSAANIVGHFNYTGSSARVRHTVALVAWNDPQDAYRQKVEYVEDTDGIARYGVIQTEIVAMGCTSRGQAHRMGKWLIYSEQNETETVTFRCGMDAVLCGPGDVIQTSDAIRAGKRFSGRLLSAADYQVRLDAEFTLAPGISYTLTCVMPDGTIETVDIITPAGTTDTLAVLPAFTAAPEVLSMWIISSDDLIPESWRIVSMSEVDKTQMDITALSYRADKYAFVEENIMLQPLPVSIIESGRPNAPEDLNFSEALYLSGVSVVATKGTVSWQTVDGAVSYVLTYTLTNQNPISITGITNNSVDIAPMPEGDYTITVYAVNALNLRSQETTISVTVYGKTVAPSDVTNFTMVALSGFAHITWDASPDLDVQVGGYMHIRFSPDLVSALWQNAVDIGPQASGNATSTNLPLLTGTYLARWVDSSGNQSVNSVSIISDAASLLTLNAFITVDEAPDFLGAMDGVLYDADLGGIKLSSVGDFDSLPGDFDDLVGPIDSLGGIAASGTYDFFNTVDLGSVQTSRLSANLEVFGYDASDLISTRGLISTWPNVGTTEVADTYAALQVRTTNDAPSGSPINWSAWQPFFVGDWTARAFEFRLLMSSDTSTHNLVVTGLQVVVDMPDRDEFGEDIASGTGAYVLTYTTAFVSAPGLSITAQNMATGDYYEITAKSETGFTIQFRNAGGSGVSRTFDYHAKGF